MDDGRRTRCQRTHISRTEGKSQSGVLTGRFRRAGRLIDDEDSNRAVNQAVARAKQGDREALRFLYLRYADHVYGYVREHRPRRATRPRTSRSTCSRS